MIERNDPCWCGSGQKWKKCHYPNNNNNIVLKTPEQIAGIKHACQVTAKILNRLCKHAKAGVTTLELDELSRELHKQAGAIPAPLGYGSPPYPKTICTSINEVICHGIPEERPLLEGDVLNIDVSCIVNGYFGDCSAMVMVGAVSEERRLVVEVAKECLARAIAVCKPLEPICSIGKAIEDYATTKGCSVVNQFVGHGVGLRFHEPPEVPHNYNNNQIPMAAGMIFTIEPMINAGVREAIIDPGDRWTARTKDGRASAQWEHTLLITPTGHEILTLLDH
jgi:methionyl aminopeptidase